MMLGHCGEEMEQRQRESRMKKKRHDAFMREGLGSKRNVSPSLMLDFSMAKMSIRGKIKPEVEIHLTENGSKRSFFVVVVVVVEVQYIVGRYRFFK